ncbi:MAG: ATP-binding protein [Oscillospiraceae bacterium]|nr:ATP-binding protein [Oscillospiraceae bacterium]
MLIGFTVENFRSFLGETTLSMVATSDKEHRAFNLIAADHEDLLKSVLIYGANASGKSNLIHALYYMKKMIVSSIDVQTEHIKTCQPFTFRADTKMLPTKFEISFLLDHVIYDYGFNILGGNINREYLYKKAQRRTLVFERTAPEFESIKLMADMADVESLKKNVRGDVLFLAWAAYTNNALAIKIVNWIADGLIIFGLNGKGDGESKTISDFAQAFVHKADNNIQGMKLRPGRNLVSSHKLYSKEWNAYQTVEVPFADYASEGTKRMYDLSDAFSKIIEKSTVIVIDEMDLHLHPALVRHLFALINSIEHNPNHAQLICTTHDVLLLDEDIRRDQIWFAEKDVHGVSSLYALSDFKDVRKNSDILKRYLLGVYGAIPDLKAGVNHE